MKSACQLNPEYETGQFIDDDRRRGAHRRIQKKIAELERKVAKLAMEAEGEVYLSGRAA